jgi:hypothetical protein
LDDERIIYIASITPGTVLQVKAIKHFEGTQRLVNVPNDLYTIETRNYGPITATQIVLTKPLSTIQHPRWADELYVTFQSEIGPHIIDVLEHLIETYTDKAIDEDSFAHVRDRLNNFPANFPLLERKNILDLLQEIAFQARCSLWLADDVFFIRYIPEEPAPRVEDFVAAVTGRLEHEWALLGLPLPRLVLEPGRSLVGRAGLTLYRVGVVKAASEATTYVAIDGGMSDNPRPQLYGARYSALLANRVDEPATGGYTVCGKHCESGDVLIDRVALPEPVRGDLLAVPATGAYALAMSSNYNSVPRPAAVLVRDGEARLIRRRETIADLLALEAPG